MNNPYEQKSTTNYYDYIEKTPEGAVQLVGSKMSEEKLGIRDGRKPVKELENLCHLFEGYKETGDSVFLNKATEYLSLWAEKYNPSTSERGVQISLDQRFFSWVFIEAEGCWSDLAEEGKKAAIILAKRVLEEEEKFWLTNNNHNNRYSYSTLTRIAGYSLLKKSGDEEAFVKLEKAVNDFFLQVRENVYEDGSTLDFHARDSIYYQVFNQVAWESIRKYLLHHQIPVPNDVKQKLDASLGFSMKYITGHDTHLEFLKSIQPRDKDIQGDKHGMPFDKNSYVVRQLLRLINL